MTLGMPPASTGCCGSSALSAQEPLLPSACGFNPWVLLGLGGDLELLCKAEASPRAQAGAVCSPGRNKASRGLHCL